jgi:alcohol dehydrogenase (cytochrome c)
MTMTRSCFLAASFGAVTLAALGIPAAVAQTGAFVPVTQAMQANPDPADWLHISRTYNQHRFSPLTQINKGNVAQLRMAWSRGLPAGTQESTPIVYRGVMYVMAPGATIQALDATNGDLIWRYERDYPRGVLATAARS